MRDGRTHAALASGALDIDMDPLARPYSSISSAASWSQTRSSWIWCARRPSRQWRRAGVMCWTVCLAPCPRQALYQMGMELGMTAEVALHLEADDRELMRRLLARAVLEGRSDDTEGVIKQR